MRALEAEYLVTASRADEFPTFATQCVQLVRVEREAAVVAVVLPPARAGGSVLCGERWNDQRRSDAADHERQKDGYSVAEVLYVMGSGGVLIHFDDVWALGLEAGGGFIVPRADGELGGAGYLAASMSVTP